MGPSSGETLRIKARYVGLISNLTLRILGPKLSTMQAAPPAHRPADNGCPWLRQSNLGSRPDIAPARVSCQHPWHPVLEATPNPANRSCRAMIRVAWAACCMVCNRVSQRQRCTALCVGDGSRQSSRSSSNRLVGSQASPGSAGVSSDQQPPFAVEPSLQSAMQFQLLKLSEHVFLGSPYRMCA